MAKPRTLVMSGYGINCERETEFAFNLAGAEPERVHINDLIDGRRKLADYQILAFPGGFSYGDDTGAGKAFANKVRGNLFGDVRRFVDDGKLIIGICNGFQILTQIGLLPAFDGNYGEKRVALVHNDSARYIDRWVDLQLFNTNIWTGDLGKVRLPIAHGEGKFYADPAVLERIHAKGLVAAQYVRGEICDHFDLPSNPNGSLDDIAGIGDESGRVLGFMPHPERAIRFTQLPHWNFLREKYKRTMQEVPEEAEGIQIFRNGVNYFK